MPVDIRKVDGTVSSMQEKVNSAKTDEEREKLHNSDLYMIAEIEGKVVFYHEAMWCKANGKLIPSGYLVFHKDGDPLNNDPDNLELVEENSEHGDLHQDSNKVFHSHNWEANRDFIERNFDDVFEAIK